MRRSIGGLAGPFALGVGALVQVAFDHLAQKIAGFREFFVGGGGHIEDHFMGQNVIWPGDRVTSGNAFDRAEGSLAGTPWL